MKRILVALLAICGLLVGAGSGVAVAEPVLPGEESIRAVERYSDQDLLLFLFAGEGKIAKEHPDLLTYLGFDPNRPKANRGELHRLVRDYLEFDTDFSSSVRKPLSSGDPILVERALISFTDSFQTFLTTEKGQTFLPPSADATARGCGVFRICVGVTLLAVANAVLYANAAAVTFVAAAAAVVWVYLMGDGADISPLERDELVVRATLAFTS